MAPAASETDKERAAKLKPLLEQYFDMPAIAKYMLGSYWRKATPEEQADFTAVLTDFLALAYGKRFATYTGHEMAVGRVRDDGSGMNASGKNDSDAPASAPNVTTSREIVPNAVTACAA